MMAYLIVLLVLGFLLQRRSLSNALDGITHRHWTSAIVVEPDERFDIITELRNTSRRFVPFLRMQESLPGDICLPETPPEACKVDDSSGNLRLLSTTYLMPHQQLQRTVTASLPRRGRYFLRGATIYGGDFLGLSEKMETFDSYQEIVVVPREAEGCGVAETLGGFLGDRSVNRFVMEDPVLTLGFSPYTGREPMKMISWSQSARRDQLMVKRLDYTLDLSVTVLLNVETETRDKHSAAQIEWCFSAARTVCRILEEKGVKYRFATNATAAGAVSYWTEIDEGLGPRHFGTILEGLGRATYDCTESFNDTMVRAAGNAEAGRSHIIITPAMPEQYLPGKRHLERKTGAQVCVLTAEEVQA